MLADFHNYFTVTISGKFAMQQSLTIPPHRMSRGIQYSMFHVELECLVVTYLYYVRTVKFLVLGLIIIPFTAMNLAEFLLS